MFGLLRNTAEHSDVLFDTTATKLYVHQNDTLKLEYYLKFMFVDIFVLIFTYDSSTLSWAISLVVNLKKTTSLG